MAFRGRFDFGVQPTGGKTTRPRPAAAHLSVANLLQTQWRHAFSHDDETDLVSFLQWCARVAQPLTKREVIVRASKIFQLRAVEVPGASQANLTRMLSRKWWTSFSKRHPELRVGSQPDRHRPRHSKADRRSGLLSASAITTDRLGARPKAGEHLERGRVRADGQKLAPFTVFKGGLPHTAYHLVGPADAAYGTSESGYINEELFGECLTNFGNHVRGRLCIEGTLLLLMDNHSSHMSQTVRTICEQFDIYVVMFPSHCTHALQPLDSEGSRLRLTLSAPSSLTMRRVSCSATPTTAWETAPDFA
uniref:DDE-1 domain-containing protein n=1 Tax=Plectus sambesii TaxID=2011161 RepID=A0A914V3I2_9BILA